MLNRDREIYIGIIGLGAMGKGLIYQSIITDKVKTVAVCDIDIGKACRLLEEFNVDYIIANKQTKLKEVALQGKIAIFEDGNDLATANGLDAVIEATGTIIDGGEFSVSILKSGKHLILMNSEIDLIFGPYLCQLAKQNGVVYTSCDGDQYGTLKHIIDEIIFWGFDLVMVGNIKGYLDRYANPTSIIPEADKRNLDYKACASYTDGTKLNIEMSLISNAIGLSADTPGMSGPICDNIDNLQSVFDFGAIWKDKKPIVDYILGAKPGGGVFTVGYCDNAYQRDMLKYYKMGNGPFYTFYRPYHLCHIESMSTVVDAVIKNEALLQPEFGFLTNVFAYAKKKLKKGCVLDGIGGHTCYGLIENCNEKNRTPGIPICLADNVRLKRDIDKDEKIYLEDVIFDSNRLDFKLYALSGGQIK